MVIKMMDSETINKYLCIVEEIYLGQHNKIPIILNENFIDMTINKLEEAIITLYDIKDAKEFKEARKDIIEDYFKLFNLEDLSDVKVEFEKVFIKTNMEFLKKQRDLFIFFLDRFFEWKGGAIGCTERLVKDLLESL